MREGIGLEKQEIELFPAGLISCLLNNKEVRILKISPENLTLRVSEEVESINEIKVKFYIFDKSKYEEIYLESYKIVESIKSDFYISYKFNINDNNYFKNVKRTFSEYSKYVRLKAYGDGNEFSSDMINYPAELDYDFYEYYSEQKYNWLSKLDYEDYDINIINNIEKAIKIDNYNLYKKYLDKDIDSFKKEYLKENFMERHNLFKENISRIYIGNEFCHNLFPSDKLLMEMIQKAKQERLDITICFTYIRECYIEKTKGVIDKLYNWCIKNNKKIEIVINDWGMIKLVENKGDYLTLSLGVLLNKRKKDPRYIYKNGYEENKNLIAKNNLNSSIFTKFLEINNIKRYEYESCGYKIDIAEGNHSLHIPFYVTNTSQYCTLYAMCTTMNRGNQKLVKECPMYCSDYVFTYPKHLKMIGRYNSLFAFDDTSLKDSNSLEEYIKRGIDRIVFNFI